MTSVVPRKSLPLSARIGWGEPVSRIVDKSFCVYILASRRNGTLYIGVTSDLAKRVWRHKEGFVAGFTKDYAVRRLVWFEQHDSAEGAITREKQLKKWNRDWKIELIEDRNPYWNDLYEEISG
jgi:putative endonuclease